MALFSVREPSGHLQASLSAIPQAGTPTFGSSHRPFGAPPVPTLYESASGWHRAQRAKAGKQIAGSNDGRSLGRESAEQLGVRRDDDAGRAPAPVLVHSWLLLKTKATYMKIFCRLHECREAT